MPILASLLVQELTVEAVPEILVMYLKRCIVVAEVEKFVSIANIDRMRISRIGGVTVMAPVLMRTLLIVVNVVF